MNLLEVENVVSGYGEMEILHDVSIRADKGEIVSMIGPNGAGKSTLMKTIFLRALEDLEGPRPLPWPRHRPPAARADRA